MRRATLVVGFLALVSGGRADAAETLRVFAAASLTEAFREVASVYEKAHPGTRVELNLAGSQVLRTQIEQGAPADVFASAEVAHADALRAPGLLDPYSVFARNRIVVVVPANATKVSGLRDLARPGGKVVVASASVPIGRYTTMVLGKLGAAGLYGDGFQSKVKGNVVSEETSVRAVLSKVALGEADAGFVYVTDAATSKNVRTIEIPDRYNVIAEYPVGMLTRSALPEKARAFIDLVLGVEGQAALRRHGFAR